MNKCISCNSDLSKFADYRKIKSNKRLFCTRDCSWEFRTKTLHDYNKTNKVGAFNDPKLRFAISSKGGKIGGKIGGKLGNKIKKGINGKK